MQQETPPIAPGPDVTPETLAAERASLKAEMQVLEARKRRSSPLALLFGRTPLGRLGRALLVACLFILALGTNVFASIPAPGGTIHACYLKGIGTLRVIDTAPTQACTRRRHWVSGPVL